MRQKIGRETLNELLSFFADSGGCRLLCQEIRTTRDDSNSGLCIEVKGQDDGEAPTDQGGIRDLKPILA